MFDCLPSRKFSNKCKHAIKCIAMRIDTIGRKKQATLRFLRKDVADLIRNGLDINAFGRIESLLVETNHTASYDMINQYCGYILSQLPTLQKQRECPQEAMEAVATLIYAAARFSDLPELCDLRRIFTERYGSHMESSVDGEFTDKIQKKTFKMDDKLQLMQSIAKEFSVTWDSKSFEQRMSVPPASIKNQSKKGTPIHNQITEPRHVNNTRKLADTGFFNSEVPSPRSISQKKIQPEPRDIHVISSTSSSHTHDHNDKGRMVISDKPENLEPFISHAAFPPYTKTKNNHLQQAIAHKGSPWVKEEQGPITMAASLVSPYRGDKVEGNAEGHQEIRTIEEPVKPKPENLKPVIINAPFPLYTKTKDNHLQQGITHKRSPWAKEEQDPTTMAASLVSAYRGDKVEANAEENHEIRAIEEPVKPKPENLNPFITNAAFPPYTKTKDNRPHKRSPWAKEEQSPITMAASLVPPYRGDNDEVNAKEYQEMGTIKEPLNPSGQERPFNMNPPYVKPKAKDVLLDAENPKPVSVRRRRMKSEAVGDIGSTIDDEYAEGEMRRDWNRNRDRNRDRKIPVGEEVVSDRHIDQSSSGRRRHGSRRKDEERVMDQLLVHYSTKGMHEEPSRLRARVEAPSSKIHQRAASVPPEPMGPAEVVRGHEHATSMQPDMLNPKGGGVHPRMPDYDELAARLLALKNG